jgi:hypothetical protein
MRRSGEHAVPMDDHAWTTFKLTDLERYVLKYPERAGVAHVSRATLPSGLYCSGNPNE